MPLETAEVHWSRFEAYNNPPSTMERITKPELKIKPSWLVSLAAMPGRKWTRASYTGGVAAALQQASHPNAAWHWRGTLVVFLCLEQTPLHNDANQEA